MLIAAVRRIGHAAYFMWDTLAETAEDGVRWELVFERGWSIGVRSMPVLVLMAIFVGSIVALQGYHAFDQLGATNMVGLFVHLAGVREVAPLLTATMVAAKAGTELAAHLAVMRSREQIAALEVMGVGPRAELVMPAMLGILLVMPALTVLCIGICLIAATYVAVVSMGLDQAVFLDTLFSAMTTADLLIAAIKGFAFGGVIVALATYEGFYSEPGPGGVGIATNRAVVQMCLICVFLNYLLTELFYG